MGLSRQPGNWWCLLATLVWVGTIQGPKVPNSGHMDALILTPQHFPGPLGSPQTSDLRNEKKNNRDGREAPLFSKITTEAKKSFSQASVR